ncbi:VOC family protein [Streptomyces hydrogenans]
MRSSMRSRTGGMWWGTTIDASDLGGLAKFYAELLDWHIRHEEPGTSVVAASPQGPFFVFQQADGYWAPV